MCKLSFQCRQDGSLESPPVVVMVVLAFTLSMSSSGMTGEGEGPQDHLSGPIAVVGMTVAPDKLG